MTTEANFSTREDDNAQVAGSTLLGVSVAELQEVVNGWSVKRTVLGQPVYNDNNERVGSVE